MRRRTVLALGAAALAGCGLAPPHGADGTATGDGPTDRAREPPVAGDVSLPVPTTEMRHPLPRDYIPAIVDPAFAPDWRGLTAPGDRTARLPDDAPVVGVERDGRARAYPLRVLDYHEVVNDALGGPLLVTYCVLCGSAVVAERRVGGEPTTFGVSGKLWRSDLVLYDRATDSLWSQLLATAIRGPRTGDRLRVLPAELTAWGEWRGAHPDGEVLLPPPASDTLGDRDREFDYFAAKYSFSDEPGVVGFESRDGDLHPKTLVLGVVHDGTAAAYPFHRVRRAGVVNDRVAGLPVAVTVTPGGSMAAWVRRIDGEVRRFRPAGDRHLQAAGSRWTRAGGRAVDGPYEGARLARANDLPPMFWTGWSEFNPDTAVYGE